MRLTRPSRHARYVTALTALIALFSMLFMQLAVASYACPALTAEIAAETQALAMTDCTGMDKEQPVLCHDKTHAMKQSADKPELPQVQPFIAAGLILTLNPVAGDFQPASRPSGMALLARTTAPPLAIQHCCFRI